MNKATQFAILALPFALVACDSLYYKKGPIAGQDIEIRVVPDVYEKCGAEAEACAYVADNLCRIWLPEGAPWSLIHHELTHCFGRVDAP